MQCLDAGKYFTLGTRLAEILFLNFEFNQQAISVNVFLYYKYL